MTCCFPPEASNVRPTFFYSGVQLCDLHGQSVNAVLERVGTQIEGVGLVEQLAKYVLRMFTWRAMAERDRDGKFERKEGDL